jgi:sugar lactone lactonase YvrE
VNANAELFVDSRSELGEGPFWHHLLKRLFWFDINNKTLLSATPEGQLVDRFTFKGFPSAAGIIDADHLLVAQSDVFLNLELSTDTTTVVAELEQGKPGNRSNDGRVDRTGGFWIGTMGLHAEKDAGALYHYKQGKVTQLLANQTIPNSTCFSPDGRTAYFTQMIDSTIHKVSTDPATGLPNGEWSPFAKSEKGGPDGAVIDAEGFMWSARYGGSCVVRHAPDGTVDRVVELPVSQVTCPALGGDDFKTLYITSARQGLTPEQLEKEPLAGSVFAIRVDVPGLPETLVQV